MIKEYQNLLIKNRRERKNRFIRIVAMILSLTMFLTAVPTECFAATAEENQTVEEVVQEDQNLSQEAQPYIIGEDVERRGEREKHFLMSDGTRVAAMYDSAVHYLDEEGNYQETNNSLDASNGEYQTKKGLQKVKMAKKASAKKLVTISKGDYKISWGFDGAKKVNAELYENIDDKSKYKKFSAKNINGKVRYLDAFENVDLEYIITADRRERVLCSSDDCSRTKEW